MIIGKSFHFFFFFNQIQLGKYASEETIKIIDKSVKIKLC